MMVASADDGRKVASDDRSPDSIARAWQDRVWSIA